MQAAVVGHMLGAGFLNPQHLLASAGLLGLCGCVFAECGLLLGFFLPGDTLLFTTGVLVANQTTALPSSIVLVCLVVTLAAITGNLSGYAIGRKAGPALLSRLSPRLFEPERVERTRKLFAMYGGRAIVVARFLALARTVMPVAAGAVRMPWWPYAAYSAVGGVLWGSGVTLLGFSMGHVSLVAHHIGLILIGGLVVSFVPVSLAVLRRRLRRGTVAWRAHGPSGDPAVSGSPSAAHKISV